MTPGARPAAATATTVLVDAPARLHLGMLDVPGSALRRYGGIGVGITGYGVRLRATALADGTCRADGPDADRAAEIAQRCVAAMDLPGGAAIEILEAIPPHVGLGSGTKLALAVARAMAELYDRPTDPRSLAEAAGRGARSAVGLWTFGGGGLVVEGGVRVEDGRPSPLIARFDLPPEWRCVVAIPQARPGLSGPVEAEVFAALRDSEAPGDGSIAHAVLTALLPAAADGEIEEFGQALTLIQRLTGQTFAAAQGGIFHPLSAPVVEAMTDLGVPGVGQSSWGPTVYGVVATPAAGAAVAAELTGRLGPSVRVTCEEFVATGARVTRR